jgi:hypothetical protein
MTTTVKKTTTVETKSDDECDSDICGDDDDDDDDDDGDDDDDDDDDDNDNDDDDESFRLYYPRNRLLKSRVKQSNTHTQQCPLSATSLRLYYGPAAFADLFLSERKIHQKTI